jgi:Flp pilus assembly protein CpaB
MRSKLPLIVALILGFISFAGIGRYMQQKLKDAEVIEDTVLVASKELKPGSVLTADAIGKKRFPAALVSQMAGVYKPGDETRIIGSKIDKEVRVGEPLYRIALRGGDVKAGGKRFVDNLLRGERAISLPLDSVGAISEFVKPGDRVDILANLEVPQTTIRTVSIPNQGVQEVPETTYTPSTLFLLEGVKVLAVGSTYLDPESPIGMSETVGIGGSGSSITIAATPHESQVLTFAMRNGSSRPGASSRTAGVTFTILLRPIGDNTTVGERTNVRYDDFLDLTKLEEIQKERNLRLPKETQSVDIFAGAQQQNP